MTVFAPVTIEDLRSAPLEVTGAVNATISGTLPVTGTVGISGTVITSTGRTLLFGGINQSNAGTTQLLGAQAGVKIKVVSYALTLSAEGTVKFAATGDLTGPMDIVAKGGAVVVGAPQSHLFETGVNQALSIITTGGAARGHFSYFLEA